MNIKDCQYSGRIFGDTEIMPFIYSPPGEGIVLPSVAERRQAAEQATDATGADNKCDRQPMPARVCRRLAAWWRQRRMPTATRRVPTATRPPETGEAGLANARIECLTQLATYLVDAMREAGVADKDMGASLSEVLRLPLTRKNVFIVLNTLGKYHPVRDTDVAALVLMLKLDNNGALRKDMSDIADRMERREIKMDSDATTDEMIRRIRKALAGYDGGKQAS